MQRRNIYLLLALILALAITGGHFAYTWITDPGQFSFPLQGFRLGGE